MTQHQIFLIKNSFEIIKDNSGIGRIFYKSLFEKYPEIKHLFKNDMSSQEKKLMHMLTVAVSNIENLAVIVPAVKELGNRHINYGVKATHYPIVGEILLQTFKTQLGEHFNFETEQAWAFFYKNVTDIMQQ